jgi:acetylornithine deacetylase/succinyl-diaminopimelate desuccinylase-like protein
MCWDVEQIADLCLAIQQVAAPTYAEHKRAEFVAANLRRLGLTEVEVDDAPNVYGRVAGGAGNRPALMVSAHLDTVFPAGTDLTGGRKGKRLFGPGVGDNSMGLAGLLMLADQLVNSDEPPASDVWFVANACEEGLGDLKGMRRALDRLGPQVKGCIVVEGITSEPWILTHRGLGVCRYKIEVRARGGHSWSAFGEPSAIHTLVGLANAITQWKVPDSPRTTFNIGVIEGGTSVNTIAEHASMLLDLRSEDAAELARLKTRTIELVAEANDVPAAGHKADGQIEVTACVVSERPTGGIPVDHPMVIAASRILEAMDVPLEEIRSNIGSTDANIPLSRGLPALTIYLTEGHNLHSSGEWLSLERLPTGMALAWYLMHWAIDNL